MGTERQEEFLAFVGLRLGFDVEEEVRKIVVEYRGLRSGFKERLAPNVKEDMRQGLIEELAKHLGEKQAREVIAGSWQAFEKGEDGICPRCGWKAEDGLDDGLADQIKRRFDEELEHRVAERVAEHLDAAWDELHKSAEDKMKEVDEDQQRCMLELLQQWGELLNAPDEGDEDD